MSTSSHQRVVRQSLSVAIATGLYGISFGALSVASGLSILQAMALSLLMFTGGSQFAFIGVLAGGSPWTAALTAGLLGVRNGFYGIQMQQRLGFTGGKKMLAAQFTIDESVAVSLAQEHEPEARTGFWWTGLGVYGFWGLFTLLGATLGSFIADPRVYGLDAAAAGAFIALLWPRLNSYAHRLTAVVAMVVTAAAIPFVPSGIPILLAAAAAAVVGGLHTRSVIHA